MDALGIKNFRSLKDTGLIELKPITLLLGKNSSGKSSFLRVLPMLRQTIEGRTRGALSLFGTLVDFGDYHNVLTSNIDEKHIEFSFKIKVPKHFLIRRYFSRNYHTEHIPLTLNLQIKHNANIDILYVSQLSISIYTYNVIIKIKEDGKVVSFCVNNTDYSGTSYIAAQLVGRLLPVIRSEKENESEISRRYPYILGKMFETEIRKYVHAKTSRETVYEFLDNTPLLSHEDFFEKIKKATALGKRWTKKSSSFTSESSQFQSLLNTFILAKTANVIESIDYHFHEISPYIKYSKPLRAHAERYYRSQALAVDEVAPDGGNIVSYINNLSSHDKNEYKKWTKEHFGFSIEIERQGGHESIIIQEDNNNIRYNLADMGFGFSQAIPIITQIWSLYNNNDDDRIFRYSHSNPQSIIYLIEQPELHLHPALQAKLIKSLVKVVNLSQKADIPIKIIAETHSETIINTIGKMIYKKELDNNLVNIVIFDKKSSKSTTDIKLSRYDNEGVLENWPFGFFDSEEEFLKLQF